MLSIHVCLAKSRCSYLSIYLSNWLFYDMLIGKSSHKKKTCVILRYETWAQTLDIILVSIVNKIEFWKSQLSNFLPLIIYAKQIWHLKRHPLKSPINNHTRQIPNLSNGQQCLWSWKRHDKATNLTPTLLSCTHPQVRPRRWRMYVNCWWRVWISVQDWSSHMSFVLKGSQISAL